jgi:HPt (histidine-containing phosphotransfer) domain-containing protein
MPSRASSHPAPAGTVILPPAELQPPAELPQALVSQYLQYCRSDLAQLKATLAVGDYETARRLGHQMKGTGKPYGFPGLTEIGRAVECAASRRAVPELDSQIQRLEVCLNRIELAFERV